MEEDFSKLIQRTQKAASPQSKKKKKKKVNNNSQIDVNKFIISALTQNPKPIHFCYFIAFYKFLAVHSWESLSQGCTLIYRDTW